MTDPVPQVGTVIGVKVTKVTLGKDGKVYVAVSHPSASNTPTLIWIQEVSDG